MAHWQARNHPGLILAALVLAACPALGKDSFPRIPGLILGVNQAGLADAAQIRAPADPPWSLTDADLKRLKAAGVNTVRFPVYPAALGLDGTRLVWTNGQAFDARRADGWPVDWRVLDAALEQLARHRLTPYICPHPYPTANWMTLYIPEDAETCLWLTRLIVRHVHERWGDNVLYGWYENIWKNSMEPWWTGVFRHTLSRRFPEEWHRMLGRLYRGRVPDLRRAWGDGAATFAGAAPPDLGTAKGVPESAVASRRSYDLRRAIDLLSRERLHAWRAELRRLAPGATWVGACLHGFYGMHDTGAGHPPKCNWGIRTHAQTGDALACDTYARDPALAVFYRTVAKIAASERRSFLASELNGANPKGFGTLAEVGGPLRGALVWCAKGSDFGLIADDGTPREDRLQALAALSRTLTEQHRRHAAYRRGRVHVYYPEETYECAVLRRSHLDAYEHVCDSLPPAALEPVLTADLRRLPGSVPLFVLERHLPHGAIVALNRLGRRVVCPHRSFIDENGRQVARSWVPDDFLAQLRAAPSGLALLESFLRVEEKEGNVALRTEGARAETPSRLHPSNEIAAGQPCDISDVIDGDAVASRVVFADERQPEVVDVTLPAARRIWGAFLESAAEDPGRTPARVRVLVSTGGQEWREVASMPPARADRTHLRFAPVIARRVRFDLGESTDGVGTRLIEVGVLAGR